MWHQIEASISEQLDTDFTIEQKSIISGGDISQAYRVSNASKVFFVKLNQADFIDNFSCEAHSIAAIQATKSISTPQVIALGTSKAHSFLVLEFVNFDDDDQDSWSQAGHQLAQMHINSTQRKYGFEDDNYIGSTLQPNKWQTNWSTFFSEQRIGFQLKLLFDKGIKLGDIDEIVGLIHNQLKPHKPEPALVHGDLWRGNISFSNQQAYIYDPACYYGDPEVDLAMTELFGIFPDDFYRAYNQINGISNEYPHRRSIYNFYHILNHLNLFGTSYLGQAKDLLKQVCLQSSL